MVRGPKKLKIGRKYFKLLARILLGMTLWPMAGGFNLDPKAVRLDEH